MNIGIDARPLSYQLTGIGYYLKSILDEIQSIDQKNNYFLISNCQINYNIINSNWQKIEGKHKLKLVSTLWMQTSLPLLTAKLKIDLLWGARHNLPLLLPPKIKSVLTIYDLVHCFYPATMSLQNFLVERLLMRQSLLKADEIITISKSTASDIQKIYHINSKRINLFYPGIPHLPEPSENIPHLPFKYFLIVSTMDPRKNIKRIFKAFELIKPDNPEVHLVIIGASGWKNEEFFNMLKIHPLNSYIHFKGYIHRNHLKIYYKNALCLLFPSLYEGFGFPMLEAMSCGTPVISSNVSSMPEIAGNAAMLVDPFDVQSIAKAMHIIAIEQKLRESLITKGLERINYFSWKRCAENIIRLFEKVIST